MGDFYINVTRHKGKAARPLEDVVRCFASESIQDIINQLLTLHSTKDGGSRTAQEHNLSQEGCFPTNKLERNWKIIV